MKLTSNFEILQSLGIDTKTNERSVSNPNSTIQDDNLRTTDNSQSQNRLISQAGGISNRQVGKALGKVLARSDSLDMDIKDLAEGFLETDLLDVGTSDTLAGLLVNIGDEGFVKWVLAVGDAVDLLVGERGGFVGCVQL